ncbi:DUF488 domain-containing protein [Nodularia spumigena CS-588/02]|uniref:DUF488 domain-containing protein n=1 Tax=Nodularia spumigena TaxID=70799 RepID=UPI0023313E0B|nr:DUF488 domain-containing protein [Nodularia spumigena]MDB9362120.1 DUF488 domain-containing protein [Nodularia spumigena CS-588/02]MDB9366662.1 DUF488 domain-containing protein [Nodularia spumigena CS-588/02A10]
MSEQVNLFTIGFTQKKAEQFFETLIKAGVKRVIDTRLNNVSQLAGFAKKNDLEYFLRKIGEEEGIYSCEEVIEELKLHQFEPDQFRLTISLSEPFIPSGQEKKFCYKLVAAVINVADVKQRLGWL